MKQLGFVAVAVLLLCGCGRNEKPQPVLRATAPTSAVNITLQPGQKQVINVTAAGAFGNPICGVSGDIAIHVPADWDTFVPPARGQSRIDSSFGCMVTRLTDASSELFNSSCNGTGCFMPIYAGYPTVSPFNANDTLLMVEDGWNEHFVISMAGAIVVTIANMPAANDTWDLWDATNPAVFYYTSGNSLMKGTINGSTVTASTVQQFTQYPAINFMDETDVSQDKQHVVLVGGSPTSAQESVFDYNFVSNQIGPVYQTQCQGSIAVPNNGCLHKLVQTPDNNIIIDFANDGSGAEQGNRLWNGSQVLQHIQDATNHLDAGMDLSGSPVFVDIGNPQVLSTETSPCASGWGTEVREINTMLANCLVDIDRYGSLSSEHVSYRGGGPSQPWVSLSFFDNRATSPEWFTIHGPNYQAPSSSNWQYLEDEIDVVRIDANNNPQLMYRLAHAYSRSDEDFYATPRAALSRDGKYVAFGSNAAFAHTGCPANFQTPTGCSDVYVIKIQ